MEELKRCPFCGSVDITIKNIDDYGGWGGPSSYKIMCKYCFAEVDLHSGSEIDAILKWNRRYEPPNEPLTLDELRQMDGEPVWLRGNGLNRWYIFAGFSLSGIPYFTPEIGYGKQWTAYRRRPDEPPAHD